MAATPLYFDLIRPPGGEPGSADVAFETIASKRVLDLRRVPVVDADGQLLVGGEAVPLTVPGQVGVKAYTSQTITQADFTSGTTMIIALTGEPTAMIPIGCYVITTGGPVAGNGDTTGLTVEVGRAADPDSLMKSVSVFGAAGRAGGLVGAELGSFRNADALEIKFTATGGDPDVVDITALSLRVVILYIPAPV